MWQTVNLSDFRARAMLSHVVVQTGPEQPDAFEEMASLAEMRMHVPLEGLIVRLALCCEFRHVRDDRSSIADLRDRLRLTASAPAGLFYNIESITNGKPVVRIGLPLSSPALPIALRRVAGYRAFKFETLRNLYQFRKEAAAAGLQSKLVDEELHERIRHALRFLSRRFQR
jgi:hypothetical protein